MTFFAILILAILVESIIEHGLPFLPSVAKPYTAIVLAVAVCVAYSADLLALLGLVPAYPIIGQILTGLVIGRGSNYLNDIWERIRTEQRMLSRWQS